jgi:hypothetical protein
MIAATIMVATTPTAISQASTILGSGKGMFPTFERVASLVPEPELRLSPLTYYKLVDLIRPIFYYSEREILTWKSMLPLSLREELGMGMEPSLTQRETYSLFSYILERVGEYATESASPDTEAPPYILPTDLERLWPTIPAMERALSPTHLAQEIGVSLDRDTEEIVPFDTETLAGVLYGTASLSAGMLLHLDPLQDKREITSQELLSQLSRYSLSEMRDNGYSLYPYRARFFHPYRLGSRESTVVRFHSPNFVQGVNSASLWWGQPPLLQEIRVYDVNGQYSRLEAR